MSLKAKVVYKMCGCEIRDHGAFGFCLFQGENFVAGFVTKDRAMWYFAREFFLIAR